MTDDHPWYTYMVRCRDATLYTGVTTDLNRRLAEHNGSSRGARYTRSRRPVTLVYHESHANRAEACRREYQLRRLSAAAKKRLICGKD